VTALLDELPTARRDRLDMTSLLQLLLEREVTIEAIAIKGRWLEMDDQKDRELYQRIHTNSTSWLTGGAIVDDWSG
jgi:dTDP-glucose pyrophosphorylase